MSYYTLGISGEELERWVCLKVTNKGQKSRVSNQESEVCTSVFQGKSTKQTKDLFKNVETLSEMVPFRALNAKAPES